MRRTLWVSVNCRVSIRTPVGIFRSAARPCAARARSLCAVVVTAVPGMFLREVSAATHPHRKTVAPKNRTVTTALSQPSRPTRAREGLSSTAAGHTRPSTPHTTTRARRPGWVCSAVAGSRSPSAATAAVTRSGPAATAAAMAVTVCSVRRTDAVSASVLERTPGRPLPARSADESPGRNMLLRTGVCPFTPFAHWGRLPDRAAARSLGTSRPKEHTR